MRWYTRIFAAAVLAVLPMLAAPAFAQAPKDTARTAGEIARDSGVANASPEQAAREILKENGIEKIVFVKRHTFQSTHYYTDFIDGAVFGTELCLLDVPTGKTTSLVPTLAEGVINRCSLSFDGTKVVFDWKPKQDEGFRVWEVGIDGKNLRQLTFPPADEKERIAKYHHPWHAKYFHNTDDMHPCYLPDGGIVFVSTRCQYSVLCDGHDVLTTTVLYRMNGDGSGMEKLSNNALSEATPCVMSDGRVLYTRWEYVDNGAVSNKGLWVVRPDGTGSEELYGANIEYPPVHYAGRPVPGTNHLFVCIGAPHMPLSVGPVILIDSRKDRRTGKPMTYITPEVEVRHQWGWDNFPKDVEKPIQAPFERSAPFHTNMEFDGKGNTQVGPLYADAFPLNEELFLVSYNPCHKWNTPNGYSLYVIDGKGGRFPLYSDKELSCWCAVPVVKSEVPPVVRGNIDGKLAERGLAHVMVTDVYQGLDGVKRGDAKYIRINEHVPRPWAARRFWTDTQGRIPDEYDQQHSVISKDTHLGLKVQHGVVPVESDGSASFYVKADKNIFFQLLDADYREIQRERTFTNFRPGEVRTCIGCHESASSASSARPREYPKAIQSPPKIPGPQPGEVSGARPIHYPTDVQPVLDKYCVSCHGGADPKGGLVLTGEPTKLFSRSYEELLARHTFPVIGENHPKMGNNHYLPPYSLGSYSGTLLKRILDEKSPCHVAMTREEMIRFTTWIDSNAQYYGTYYGPKALQYADMPGYRHVPTFEETQK